jgi:hypothetical protein
MTNIEHYESHFKIHQGHGRHYYIIFQVSTTIPFQALKQDATVLQTLKQTDSYPKRHHWAQDQWDIVTLGFMLEVDPEWQMADEVIEKIIDLPKAKECATTPGS